MGFHLLNFDEFFNHTSSSLFDLLSKTLFTRNKKRRKEVGMGERKTLCLYVAEKGIGYYVEKEDRNAI